MKKLTLPLVMIASLATLVSCGEKTAPVTPLAPVTSSAVTGAVVTNETPVVANTGIVVTQTETQSGATATPVMVTRKETVTYQIPPGDEFVEFDVTLTDGVITAVAATSKAPADHAISIKLQEAFAAGIAEKAIGKKAKDLDLDVVGGASLTTAAFEKFVQAI
ncbi:hypothetical protein HOO68_02325 [Candidatus Gracilibacteria bacterium]|nr:hypothetical protein [Candidatus Gracilibacteria bacterium]